jgi:VanZ family protein
MVNKSAALCAWLLLAAIAFVTLSPIDLRPRIGHASVERFLAFVALGAAFGVGYPHRARFAVAITALAALGLEVAQLFAHGRHGRIVDAGEKLAGGMTGLAIAIGCLALLERFRGGGP